MIDAGQIIYLAVQIWLNVAPCRVKLCFCLFAFAFEVQRRLRSFVSVFLPTHQPPTTPTCRRKTQPSFTCATVLYIRRDKFRLETQCAQLLSHRTSQANKALSHFPHAFHFVRSRSSRITFYPIICNRPRATVPFSLKGG